MEDHQDQIGGTGHTRDASLDLHLISSNVKKNAMHVLLIDLYKIKDPIHMLLNFIASSSELFHFKQFQLLFTSKNIGRWVGMFESVILVCRQVLVFCVEIRTISFFMGNRTMFLSHNSGYLGLIAKLASW